MLHSLRAFTSRIWPRLGLLALQELDERVLSFLKLAGKGADKNKASEDGFTPLIRASFANHVEVVRLLIAAGDDNDSVTREQGVFSALHFAVTAEEGVVFMSRRMQWPPGQRRIQNQ